MEFKLLVMVKNLCARNIIQNSVQGIPRARGAAGGGGGGGPRPPNPPPPPDLLSQTNQVRMVLPSLDSVILVIVTCNRLPLSYSRSVFWGHIS